MRSARRPVRNFDGMKALRWILGLSLVANLVLAAMNLLSASAGSGAPHGVRGENRAATNSSSTKPAASGAGLETARSTAQASTWADLRSDDLALLVQHLRAAGFPPKVVRAVANEILD